MNLKTKKVTVGSQALSQQNLCGGLGTKQVSASIEGKCGGGTTDHSKLKNLDYEHSGHTGFASSQDLNQAVIVDSAQQTIPASSLEILRNNLTSRLSYNNQLYRLSARAGNL